jgi:membrane protein DedA with SNARE-associated domain
VLVDLKDWVTEVIDALGYVGVAFLVAIENLFPPIPSEVILPLAGFVAGRGDANLALMIMAATAGSLVGAWILYGVSALIGPTRMRAFLERYGRWVGVRPADLDRAEAWFDRRAVAAVLLGRCIPLVRSVVSIPAGFRRMPPAPFTICTVIGSTVWNTSLIGAGAVLGERWDRVGDVVGLLQGVVIIAGVAAVVAFAWVRYVRPRLARAGQLPPETAPGELAGRDDLGS